MADVGSEGGANPEIDPQAADARCRLQKRKWWLAIVLGIAATGLGQVYNGQWKRGLSFFSTTLVAPFLLSWVMASGRFWLGMGLVCAFVATWSYSLTDAAVSAIDIGRQYSLKPFNRVVVYLVLILLAGIIPRGLLRYTKGHLARAFRTPSQSMEPTLEVGDYFFADMRASARHPSRGDLVVHDFPQSRNVVFIKRVVAIEGDTVAIHDKALYLNGRMIDEPFAFHADSVVRPGGADRRDNYGPVIVAPGSVFVLGDNRDNSYDSRYWGAIPASLVRGTVRVIYWSWDSEHETPRWDRIGHHVH